MGARNGCRVWIVGILERSWKKMIPYPIDCQPEEIFLRLTDKHVEKGRRIFTDGWAAYGKLTESGYEHFTVVHSYQFSRKYINRQTGQEVVCHIFNKVEDAWAHAKKHVRLCDRRKKMKTSQKKTPIHTLQENSITTFKISATTMTFNCSMLT